MKYSEVRYKLTTGSIVLFRGKGFASNLILWFCSIFSGRPTKYSHVGMIVADKDRKFIFESTTLNGRNGVQMNLFSEAVRNYKGRMVVRQLHTKLSACQIIALQQFISDSMGKPYEKHIWELIGAATPWHIFKENNKDFFCSELVARVYQIWRLLPGKPDAKEYSPEAFAMNGEIDQRLLFSDTDAWLDFEIEVK